MKVQKSLAPMLIILLIAAATFGYLIYSGKISLPQKQTPEVDETVSWKEYKNKDYSFKYPNNWQAKVENSLDRHYGEIYNENEQPTISVQDGMTPLSDNDCNDLFDKIISNKQERFKSLEGGIGFGHFPDGKISKRLVQKNNVILGNQRWDYMVFDTSDLSPERNDIAKIIYVCTKSGNKVYFVIFNDHSLLKDLDLYKKILSTFKFTK